MDRNGSFFTSASRKQTVRFLPMSAARDRQTGPSKRPARLRPNVGRLQAPAAFIEAAVGRGVRMAVAAAAGGREQRAVVRQARSLGS